eukprot:g6619.t1
MKHKRWLPLEANPDVMTDFSRILGLDTTRHSFSDVYGLDPELLSFVPGPVRAILLLFPIDERSEQYKHEEQMRIEKDGQIVSPNVYFMKQTVGNACGTIALLHSIFNNMERLDINDGSFLSRFYELSKNMSPIDRANLLENPKDSEPDIEKAHEEAASSGDTQPPSLDQKINLHFVCLIEKDGGLYELDGRKEFPIYHGPASEGSLLNDSVPVIQEFMNRTESIEFSVISLS